LDLITNRLKALRYRVLERSIVAVAYEARGDVEISSLSDLGLVVGRKIASCGSIGEMIYCICICNTVEDESVKSEEEELH
jgi:hypothetical protein